MCLFIFSLIYNINCKIKDETETTDVYELFGQPSYESRIATNLNVLFFTQQ